MVGGLVSIPIFREIVSFRYHGGLISIPGWSRFDTSDRALALEEQGSALLKERLKKRQRKAPKETNYFKGKSYKILPETATKENYLNEYRTRSY